MATAPLKASDVKGGYKPSKEDLERVKMKKDHFKLSGDGIFHTIQGEGPRAGYPTTFVRLHICNLQCEWCDAWYTWKGDTEEYYTEPFDVHIDDLMSKILEAQLKSGVKNPVKNITFTGGEPMLQRRLIQSFADRYKDRTIQIETNGTLMPSKYLLDRCFFNVSPKLEMSGNSFKRRFSENVLKMISEMSKYPCFKFVFKTEKDIDEVGSNYPMLPKEQIRMMPEGVTKEENTKVFENTIDYLVASGYNVAIRGQNVMRDGALRGV